MTSGDQTFFVGPDGEPDKYRLRAEVSAGGEAELWQAEVGVAGEWEPVAVKVLRPHLMADIETWRARWAEQVELLRFVRHPGVVGIREGFEGPAMHSAGEGAGTHGRSFYLVMNWIEGQDLRTWVPLHRTPGDLFEGIRYLQQIATVLDWLHSGQATPSGREVVHADVSPANVVVTPKGQAVLVDFGLLRVAPQAPGRAEGTYIAPEVRDHGAYSAAADRYSFGGLAYFVLTGAQPPSDAAALRAGLGEVGLIAADPGLLDELMPIFSDDPGARPACGDWVRLLRQFTSTLIAAPVGAAAVVARSVTKAAPASRAAVPAAERDAWHRRVSGVWLVAAAAVVLALVAGSAVLLVSAGLGHGARAGAVAVVTPSSTAVVSSSLRSTTSPSPTLSPPTTTSAPAASVSAQSASTSQGSGTSQGNSGSHGSGGSQGSTSSTAPTSAPATTAASTSTSAPASTSATPTPTPIVYGAPNPPSVSASQDGNSINFYWSGGGGNGLAISYYSVCTTKGCGAQSGAGSVNIAYSCNTTESISAYVVDADGTHSSTSSASATTAGCQYFETVGGVTSTFTNEMNESGTGPTIAKYQTVQVTCRTTGMAVPDGNTWWYRIASSPWNNAYYASADAFYNDGATSGSLSGTPFFDPAVPVC